MTLDLAAPPGFQSGTMTAGKKIVMQRSHNGIERVWGIAGAMIERHRGVKRDNYGAVPLFMARAICATQGWQTIMASSSRARA